MGKALLCVRDVIAFVSTGLSIDDAGLLTDNTGAIETTLCVSSLLESSLDSMSCPTAQATANVLEQTLAEASGVAAAAERVRELSKERCRG